MRQGEVIAYVGDTGNAGPATTTSTSQSPWFPIPSDTGKEPISIHIRSCDETPIHSLVRCLFANRAENAVKSALRGWNARCSFNWPKSIKRGA